jgi:hypothetical protein
MDEQPPDFTLTKQERHAVWVLLDKLQQDNREQTARLIELRSLVAALGVLPNTVRRENAAAYRPYGQQRDAAIDAEPTTAPDRPPT